jgi:Ca2+-binding RTX toxin-like protein
LLTGGAGADHFRFDTALTVPGVATITDFAHGVDKIELSHAIFSKTNPAGGTLKGAMFFVGAHAHDGNDHLIYNKANGWLIYDSNGNAAGGEHHFATLAAHLTVSASDFLIV